MTRQIIPTDQELINWVEKSGMNIVRTDDAIRVRNIALKEINGMNKEFVIKEKSDLQLYKQSLIYKNGYLILVLLWAEF